MVETQAILLLQVIWLINPRETSPRSTRKTGRRRDVSPAVLFGLDEADKMKRSSREAQMTTFPERKQSDSGVHALDHGAFSWLRVP